MKGPAQPVLRVGWIGGACEEKGSKRQQRADAGNTAHTSSTAHNNNTATQHTQTTQYTEHTQATQYRQATQQKPETLRTQATQQKPATRRTTNNIAKVRSASAPYALYPMSLLFGVVFIDS